MVFQPVVDLASGRTVGFEALARGPAGTPWQSPVALFDAARRVNRVAELDWICRARAVRDILDSGLPRSLTWFVNSEPAGYTSPAPADLAAVFADASRAGLRLVIEVTERDLVGAPGVLLNAVDRFRQEGWGVALDDVGSHPGSLALLPILAPDVVKLDLTLVQASGSQHTARIANAVRAYAERTGAIVVAEGVDEPRHREAALVLGAGHAQGYHLGEPAPLPVSLPEPGAALPTPGVRPAPEPRTPYQAVRLHRTARETTKELLVPMSRYLERQALAGGESYLVVGAFEHRRHFTPATRRVHAELARRQAYVVSLGVNLPEEPEPGIQGIALDPADPLAGEWLVIVVGAHFAGALVALALDPTSGPGGHAGHAGPGWSATAGGPTENGRRFTYVITHDRDLVIAATRAAFRWVGPAIDPLRTGQRTSTEAPDRP